MSDLYSNPDPDFAVATLARALRELLITFVSAAPERDADGGGHASWWLVLRPADGGRYDVPAVVAAPAVTVSVDADSTRIEVTHPVGEETYRPDDGAAGVIVAGSPYAVRVPAGSVRILTRLVMDLWQQEQQSAHPRGRCQLCGKGRALSIWRPTPCATPSACRTAAAAPITPPGPRSDDHIPGVRFRLDCTHFTAPSH
ncbi:hypothetical protein ACFXPW_25330 [Streptomyces goshikiensis]|uniref:hypothetical protein n=1 Tax=Streptomyces goshikiensis TaxID=1942 RepID=UPI00368DE165